MRFQVHHYTHYEYSCPVALGNHVLRLLPQGSSLSFLSHDLTIEPVPVARNVVIDAQGNRVLHVAFEGTTTVFRIDSRFEALTESYIPYFDPGLLPLPWQSGSPGPPLDSAVIELARDLARDVNHQPLAFAEHLTRTLFSNIDRQVRLEGEAQTSAVTLKTLRGACRDITVLFMDCCRALGMTTRFVSGYQSAAETPDGQRYLHAWPEIYLPGLGFRGYDPTHGIAVSDGHIMLCAALRQSDTMPVEGGFSFHGPSVSSTLKFAVTIETKLPR